MQRREYILQNLRKYGTLRELRGSRFYAECRAEITNLLESVEVVACPGAGPRLRSFLRLAQWNVEKGRNYQGILSTFRMDPSLRWADVILLNEADFGMIRSGNEHVARRLAADLGMNMVFAPAHIELTKGTGEELDLPGENGESLQGNAVLSRFPVIDARVVTLPRCFEPYEFHEKRYGGRNCVWAKLQAGDTPLWIGSVHLEVRRTPACRGVQMKHVLSNLPGGLSEPHILGGDLNSNGFPRGTLIRTLRSVWRLLSTSPHELGDELCHPERGFEPLFRAARARGFEWEGLNSFEVTASAPIGGLEDSDLLPRFLSRYLRNRVARHGSHLNFKLDWLLGRQVRPLRSGEVVDDASGVASENAGCIPVPRSGPERISDHLPIYADIRLQPAARFHC